jgi:ABC-2 type transport system permease protein
MRLYLKYFAINFTSQMQHKASFFMTMAGQFLVSFSALLGVYFMFLRFNTVEGFTFGQVLICFAVVLMSFSSAEMFARGFDLFPQMLGNGQFDRALVRPRGVIFQVLGMKMEFSRFGRFFQAVLIIIYAIPNCGVVWSADKIGVLCLMIVCGAVVFFALFLVYAAFSFFTVQGLEFMNVFTDGGREFGKYPFSVYGEGILRFLTYVIPLALFQYYPLLYLLGRETGLRHALAPVASLLLVVPAYGFFRFGLRRYKSTGS